MRGLLTLRVGQIVFCDPVKLPGPDVELSKLDDARRVTRDDGSTPAAVPHSWNCNADDRGNHEHTGLDLTTVYIPNQLRIATIPFSYTGQLQTIV